MKKMKRILPVLAALLLVLTLLFAACADAGTVISEVSKIIDDILTETEETAAPPPEGTESDSGTSAYDSTAPPAGSEKPEETETPAVTEPPVTAVPSVATEEPLPELDKNGTYTSKEDVALYLYLYGKLPSNFVTKTKAREKGWNGGGLDGYFDGKSIGGDVFRNLEGLLPEKKGRTYYECDIDTAHKSSRGTRRIVYSNDGLIYYTGDHYESFELLYERGK